LENQKIKDQSLFASWNILSKFERDFSGWFSGDETQRPIEYQKLLQFWLHTDSAKNVDASVMAILRKTQPKSVNEMARSFKTLIQQLKSKTAVTKALPELVRQLQSTDNPLNGPNTNIDLFLDESQTRLHTELKSKIGSLKQSKPIPGVAMGVTEAKPENLKVHLRGSHLALGKTVPRRFLKIINGDQRLEIGDDRSGRLEFANWMTRPSHPLTSRVIVNRIWHWHFGRGIVQTVDNFGLLGQAPSHPELLDWLASRLISDGWSLKKLHREIMLSQTYRMSATGNPSAERIDPENQWLWRFRRRRLTAEETRDAVISVSTGIDNQMFGTLLKAENRKYVTSSSTTITDEYSNRRRSIYLPVVRSSVYDVFQTLDFPDPAVSTGTRQVSTIAPQALMMMNSQLIHSSTQAIAEALAKTGQVDSQNVRTAYQRILKRNPSPSERTRLVALVERMRSTFQANRPAGTDTQPSLEEKVRIWQSVCRILISTNEFSFIE
ncbi:MAG: DUF1553 domain-containing protein, partial [Planctomycetota bacterium]|nr:DUF1553 domain-containing protein [Planctomycetota bacterium]